MLPSENQRKLQVRLDRLREIVVLFELHSVSL